MCIAVVIQVTHSPNLPPRKIHAVQVTALKHWYHHDGDNAAKQAVPTTAAAKKHAHYPDVTDNCQQSQHETSTSDVNSKGTNEMCALCHHIGTPEQAPHCSYVDL